MGHVDIGHIAFMVRHTDGINELRIRVWLGEVSIRSNRHGIHLLNRIANTYPMRLGLFQENHAKLLYMYLCESMFCVRTFLPGLFTQRVYYYKLNMLEGEYESNYGDVPSTSEDEAGI